MSFPTVPGAGGLPKVVLSSRDGARAEIYLHGAQLTSWIPAGSSADRLFLSARSRFSDGAAIRGGIPVSFPQFAAQGPLPNHGFARVMRWELARADIDDDGSACAVLRLGDSDATRQLWPHAFALELSVRLSGASLDVGLGVVNTGADTLRLHRGASHVPGRGRRGADERPRTAGRRLHRQGPRRPRLPRDERRPAHRGRRSTACIARRRPTSKSASRAAGWPCARPAFRTPSYGIPARQARRRWPTWGRRRTRHAVRRSSRGRRADRACRRRGVARHPGADRALRRTAHCQVD